MELAAERGAEKFHSHAFDGRDTRRRAALKPSLKTPKTNSPRWAKAAASIVGRYYAMDRDNRWDRVEKRYDSTTLACGEFRADTAAVAGLQAAYARDEKRDEFVKATAIRAEAADAVMEDGDTLIFGELPQRPRARKLPALSLMLISTALRVRRWWFSIWNFVMLTECRRYHQNPPAVLPTSVAGEYLGEWMAKNEKLSCAYFRNGKICARNLFFNGGVEEPFGGEERILINSRKYLPLATCNRK